MARERFLLDLRCWIAVWSTGDDFVRQLGLGGVVTLLGGFLQMIDDAGGIIRLLIEIGMVENDELCVIRRRIFRLDVKTLERANILTPNNYFCPHGKNVFFSVCFEIS